MSTGNILIRAAFFVCATLLTPSFAIAADISFSPSSGSFPLGTNFSIKVMVDPGADSVNASDGTLSFDKSVLSVVSVTKEGSVFSLWTADPSFSNGEGTVTYSGGSPAGTSKAGNLITITFKPLKIGSAKVSVTKATVLAADGKGTDVFKTGNDATLTITDAPAAADDNSNVDATGPAPVAPGITSLTFPKEDVWYSTTTGSFTWIVPPDITKIRLAVATNATDIPAQQLKNLATSTKMTVPQDGVWYFLLQFKNDVGWGDVAKKKLNIDTTPPSAFDIALSDQGTDLKIPKFKFAADDALSGIDHYDIFYGKDLAASVQAGDMTNGATPVPPTPAGPQTVTIKAYDKAGNVRPVVKDFTLPAVAKPLPKGSEDALPPANPWTIERFAIMFLVLLVGSMIAWNYRGKRALTGDHAKLWRQIIDMGEKNDRVFQSMREEFEAMINDFDEKPQLTAQERQLLEDIKEVLDLAEEVIDTQTEELKKMIRAL